MLKKFAYDLDCIRRMVICQISALGISEQRRPAKEARMLYVEMDASIALRTAQQEHLRLALVPGSNLKGVQPSERDA